MHERRARDLVPSGTLAYQKLVNHLGVGVSDARHLVLTLTMIGGIAEMDGLPEDKCFHFTLLDCKPAVMARDVLILQMLNEMTTTQLGTPGGLLLRYTLFYLYLAPVLPKMVYRMLQSQIRKAIDALEGRRSLPAFMDVPMMHRPEILRILREWQGDAIAEYDTRRVMLAKSQRTEDIKAQVRQLGSSFESTPPGCEKEEIFYRTTGILMLPGKHQKLYASESPDLCKAYERFDKSRPQNLSDDTIATVDSSWATNVTMVDLLWLHRQAEDEDLDVTTNPYLFGSKLCDIGFDHIKNVNGMFDYVLPFFDGLAVCLNKLKSRIKIEACIGDVLCVLEQIRFDVGHRQFGSEEVTSMLGEDPAAASGPMTASSAYSELEEYPKMFDRTHLSNIPDYIGGTLTSFLYALPLTWPDKSSYITATCLRNPPRFHSVAHFNNEYIGLSAPSKLEKVFHVRMGAYARHWRLATIGGVQQMAP